jgi:DNA adenine methylase
MKRIPHRRDQKYHYSPLRYPGGKTFLFPYFDQVIKDRGLRNVTYVEPFAGGAGAALALLFLEKVERIVINDLDRAIYAFWKSAILDSERFIDEIQKRPVTVREWKKQKEVYANKRSKLFDLGFATFFLNRTNVSGILDGGPIGGVNQRGRWKIDARFNKATLVERISQLSQYSSRIAIENKDGVDLIVKYLNDDDAFIYLDPPYYDKGAALYLNHYKQADHERLARRLNRKPNSNWVLTYDNKNEIKSLYPDRKIINYSLNYNAYESRIGREVLILSDAFTR